MCLSLRKYEENDRDIIGRIYKCQYWIRSSIFIFDIMLLKINANEL